LNLGSDEFSRQVVLLLCVETWLENSNSVDQSIVLAHEHCLQGSQKQIFIRTDVAG